MRTHKRKYTRARGFTLLEVLLVITILGILAAFVVPSLMNAQSGAERDIAQAAVGKSGPIAIGLDMFRMKVGRYPTSDEGLKALIEKPDDTDEFKQWINMIPDPEMLQDPWSEEYQYRGPDDAEFNEGRYDLFSKGPDKEEGTDDDIGNWTKED